MENVLVKMENKELFCKFVHECIDDLIGKKKANFNTSSGEVEWTAESFQKSLSMIQNMCCKAISSKDKDIDHLKIPNLKQDFQNSLIECYNIRKPELEQFLLKKELSEGEQLFVENIDWKVKYIMGSSSLPSLREPRLQMQLLCLKRPTDKTRPCINFEMTIDQVRKLISELEAVKEKLQS